jgi:hypothetical protein
MNTPGAVSQIMARITEVSQLMTQAPTAVAALDDRFARRLDAATTAAGSTSSTSATRSATITRPAGGMQAPRIDRTGVTSGRWATGVAGTVVSSPAGLPQPTGTWVDRVPNARGKALTPAIQAAATKYGLDPAFLAAVFWTESSYTPDVVSPTGAIGLGQLMPETAEWLQVNPWDPMQNIDGSAKFYKYLLDRNHGSLELAIASYAAGPGAVDRAGGVPDQFTANYITKLLGRRDYLNGLRATPP